MSLPPYEQEGGESEIIIAPLKVCARVRVSTEMMCREQQLPSEAKEAKIAAGLSPTLFMACFMVVAMLMTRWLIQRRLGLVRPGLDTNEFVEG